MSFYSKALPTSSDCLHSTLTAALPDIITYSSSSSYEKFITQLVILTLSLLLVNAHDDINHYSTHPFTAPIRSCCDLRIFPPDRVPTRVYKMSMGTFDTANVYCNIWRMDCYTEKQDKE